ncbi:hypothetical protein D3C76_596440 [compost metagenome]|uniref:Uncharacterized protein n=1 Tax=Pseudomonas jinjuensis TaxID=198616 RepID=A0A1H0LPN1_9PSED|nr:hypothetical protein [Pseudomonas jinjuensis]SDO70085.1 hypothetical protein SAMN05216193_114144 [Pseudomonas jinjuensis]
MLRHLIPVFMLALAIALGGSSCNDYSGGSGDGGDGGSSQQRQPMGGGGGY